MGSKKLVYCCIVGILLGFLAPLVLKTDRHTSLMVGMVAGLGIGYLLDVRDSKQADRTEQKSLGEKADRANKLLERARRGVENEYLRMDYDDEEEPAEEQPDEEVPVTDTEDDADEQAEKLNEAEELLRAARERMKR